MLLTLVLLFDQLANIGKRRNHHIDRRQEELSAQISKRRTGIDREISESRDQFESEQEALTELVSLIQTRFGEDD